MGQSQSATDPTGVGYLKTFQAIFQMTEIALGIVVWAMLASEPYYKYPPLHFALGMLVTAWCITLIFFVLYLSGTHIRVNNFFASRSSSGAESGETSAGSLAPPSGSTVPRVRWFVAEYILYLIMSILLFIALICVTSQLHHRLTLIVTCALGWLLAILYELHFCLLFRNVESVWPYQWCYTCVLKCCPSAKSSEREGLVPGTAPVAVEPSAPPAP